MSKVDSITEFEHKVHDLEIKERLEKRVVDKDMKKVLLYSGVGLSLFGLAGLILSFFRKSKKENGTAVVFVK